MPAKDKFYAHGQDGRFVEGNPYRLKKGTVTKGAEPRRNITLSAAFRAKLASECPDDPERRTWAEVIGQAMVSEAAAGKVQAAKELREATEGSHNQVTFKNDWRALMLDDGRDPEEVLRQLADHLLQGKMR